MNSSHTASGLVVFERENEERINMKASCDHIYSLHMRFGTIQVIEC